MFCTECGAENLDDEPFCHDCGHPRPLEAHSAPAWAFFRAWPQRDNQVSRLSAPESA